MNIASAPVLELQDVTVSFGRKTVLKNVSFAVHARECLVLIGPSGQGKSVLLKILAGLVRPTSGTVLVEGRKFHELPPKEQDSVVRRMGFLFQRNALFDSLTVADNVRFPLEETTSIAGETMDRRVALALQQVGLSHASALFPDEVSGGMQKRLGIARALVMDPEIVFYDDPTAGLDPITSRKIVDLILDLKQQNNSTVVAITNDMNRAYQMATRIAMVVDQSVIITGDAISTKKHPDPRVHQFISGALVGPLTEGMLVEEENQ